jgi:glycosyltransferase involved in cell wall biosynthesis
MRNCSHSAGARSGWLPMSGLKPSCAPPFPNWSRAPGSCVTRRLKSSHLATAPSSVTGSAIFSSVRRSIFLRSSGSIKSQSNSHAPVETNEPRLDGNVRFVFSGRFVDWKGIQYLVRTFVETVAKEPRCQLDLISGGELEDEIKALIKRHEVDKAVHLHGWLSRPEAARIVRGADVFVMPSLRECGGTAILEAMALGKPIIATNWKVELPIFRWPEA